MRSTTHFLFGIGLTIAFAACKDVESNAPYIHQMEDSVFKAFPTVNRASIEIKENTDVIITIGDAELYNASEEQRKAVAEQLTNMSVHFFDKNNYLSDGKVHFVAEENTVDVKKGSEKTYDMDIKKAQSAIK